MIQTTLGCSSTSPSNLYKSIYLQYFFCPGEYIQEWGGKKKSDFSLKV